ncbi:unnamed protein product [Tilletia controversa]|uniref:Transmembrane protein 135 N-terminal domain-containing protein n=1 Tax=Tilletia controversa TaxID=13291 RepID=A0A8X7MJ70_9BASI|nr:hypothetical protein CF328_g8275 [Tilletia controversa]KAE8238208.1 hypothetical protein A4X06_0g8938 [Tilletia controversa]CAD6936911.1 unnamed protein product [Tilletia controversa]CAD6972332.1 unnamed protein product [Tilletia controversa]CAD6984211.1 unnamed protein product [Tilletia controversa]
MASNMAPTPVAAAAAAAAVTAVRKRSSAAAQLATLLQPAIKAWLLGYAFDYIPAILKLILRFVVRQSRALAEVRKQEKEKRIANGGGGGGSKKKIGPFQAFQPALKAAPALFLNIGKATVPPLSPSGTAALSFLATACYSFSDHFFWWPIIRRFITSRSAYPNPGSQAALDQLARARVAATFISASLASALSITYLQFLSPTLDLTLFAFVRGLDTFVRASPLVYKALFMSSAASVAKQTLTPPASGIRSAPTGALRRRIFNLLGSQADGLVFVVCCAQIMWAWFYYPDRLPPSYSKWISNLAWMDDRLLEVLRWSRNGVPHEWSYRPGQSANSAAAELGGSLAESLGYPRVWGNPGRLPGSANDAHEWLLKTRAENRAKAKAEGRNPDELTPAELDAGYVYERSGGARRRGQLGGMPCELVHCGITGHNCYTHAALRWWNGWKMSMRIYLPVHLLPKLLLAPRRAWEDPKTLLKTVALGSARSASFLATFLTIVWFSVCLVRSVAFPRMFPHISHQYWDSGLGPLIGSWLCGFSIFLEEKRKRAEMALYVAPRALFALAESVKPGWLSKEGRSAKWTERVVFGLSLGVVISAARHRPDLLRGITAILGVVVRPANAKRRPVAAIEV